MPIQDVLKQIAGEPKEKGKAKVKYVQFTIEEWEAMEKANGGSIEPVHVKKLVQQIFSGEVDVRMKKVS